MNTSLATSGNSHIGKVRWWHEQIVDTMLAFPHWTQGQIAVHFDKTEAWLSSVINSNVFQDYYKRRIDAHQAHISKNITAKVEDVAVNSLDAINKKIKEADEEIPLSQLKETSEMALKAMGFGQKQGRPAGNSLNINVGEGGNINLEAMLADLDNPSEPQQKEIAENPPSSQVINGESKEIKTKNKMNKLPF